ncbi:MAG: hypothetical protein KF819_02710 [Labilithrix sp.]|nr:hypothetical protein [Labilithrix sp.]
MDRILVRSMLLRLAFVAVFVFVALAAQSIHPRRARADVDLDGAPVRVSSALFTPTRTDAGITWDARWTLTPDAPATLDDGRGHVLRFAIPLSEGETLDPSPAISAVTEDGRIVGVRLARGAASDRVVRATLRQPSPRSLRDVPLGAPVAAGTALQIVDADLGGGTRFELASPGTLERHVGHVSPPGVGHAQREEARRLTGYKEIVTGAPIYVRGDDVHHAGGLVASVVTPGARSHGGAIALGGGFVAAVAALLFAVKRLRTQATVERADALLAAEVEAAAGMTSLSRGESTRPKLSM